MHAVVTRDVGLRAPLHRVAVPDALVPTRGVTLLEGPNGAGKSAFVELCAGTTRARHGVVRVLGHAPTDVRARRDRSVCRTSIGLAPDASVRQHVGLFSRASGVDAASYLRAFAEFGAVDWIDAPSSALSTGLARLAWVLLASVPPRALLVLDEPFLGLDAAASAALQARLEARARTGAVLVVDHGPARAWTAVAHRVAMELA